MSAVAGLPVMLTSQRIAAPNSPLAPLANGELRHKRILAHHALHNVQTSLGMNRDQSYRWLQTQMRLPGDQVHIAKCGDYLCEQIIRICENATTSHK